MSQISRDADQRQAAVEDPLAALGAALALIEHDQLRVRQAIRRSGMDDLLVPVLEDYARISAAIQRTQRALRANWEAGQGERWRR